MGGKKRKKRAAKGKINVDKLKDRILQVLEKHPSRGFSSKQVSKRVEARDIVSKHAVSAILSELKKEGKLKQRRNGSYSSNKEPEYVEGIVDYVNARFAYVNSGELEEDVWIPTEHILNALDGDTVKVMLFPQLRKGRKPEGRVVEILNRGRTEFVGRVEMTKSVAFVVPDSRKMHEDIVVHKNDLLDAKEKDKVIVKIKNWPSKNQNPTGIITQVLGKAGENEAEIHSIVAEYGLPISFQKPIENAAAKINDSISQAEIKRRKDFRNITTFTIDPEDAKDFDDALSIQTLENGNIEVGVHIADVSHYLKEGGVLDKEAYKRATSIYLVDRTIPMLPERLSNDLCSLNPKEDKLTYTTVFELDENAHVQNQWIGRTVIHSDKRFSYEEAQQTIDDLKGPFFKELSTLNQLALKLRADRFMKGSVNFETSEVKFKLDANGKPLGIIPKVRKDAHKMIEEFMLLANKRVAELIGKQKESGKKKTFVYRTHDFPDPDRINAFSVFARKFGYKLETEQNALANSLNTLIEEVVGRPEQNVLQTLAIRSMAKAKYTTSYSSHFGLAFPYYTHFTSPIRRYPDVMVHRLLTNYLAGNKSPDAPPYEEKCKHSSEMEVKAAEAERDSIKYKQVEYIETVKDQIFDGVVSGVQEYGVWVEMIENKCEGMVRVSALKDDYYDFDEENYCLIGRRNKKKLTLGDNVKVKVIATDIDRRTIDLEFVDSKI